MAADAPRILEVHGRRPNLAASVFVAPGATVAGDVTVEQFASIWFGCVVRSEREALLIGRETNVQDLTVIHADPGYPVRIGARVTIGHRVVLHGCVIEDDALIGMGAVVLNGATIGAGAVVAAGAVVSPGTTIPPMTLAMGVPAKPTDRPVPDVPRANVNGYKELAEWYREAVPRSEGG